MLQHLFRLHETLDGALFGWKSPGNRVGEGGTAIAERHNDTAAAGRGRGDGAKPFMNIPLDWIRALEGGALIGLSASLMLGFNGRVTGISGIVGGLLKPTPGDISWRALFVAGLVLGGLVAMATMPGAFSAGSASLGVVVIAGLLVGFGTRVGNGCTSGHGVCGISRFSPRSIAATLTFIGTGALTVLATGGGR